MKLKPKPLKGYKNFKLLFQKGLKLKMDGFTLIYSPAYDFPLKYAIVVNSKFGKAVKRNRLKRQAKSFFLSHSLNLLPFFGNILIYFQRDFNLDYFNMHNFLIKSFMELRKCLKELQ